MLPLILEDVSFVAGGRAIIDRVSCEFTPGPRTVILGPERVRQERADASVSRAPDADVGPHRVARQPRRAQAARSSDGVSAARHVAPLGAWQRHLRAQARWQFPARERDRRAREVLDAVGLSPVANRPARVLSGGEQQKLALARAWALAPEVLFLDEPTANLDPGATREVERIVDQIHGSGTKIVMTTHNLGQARRLADEILFMSGGRLADHAPVRALLRATVDGGSRCLH